MAKKFNLKYMVFLPLVLAITIFLWAVPVSFFGIEALTVVQQRVIALFVFAALMWIFEIIPNWATSLLVIVISLLTVSNRGIGLFCDPQYGTLVPYARIMSSMADPVVMLFLGGFVLAIMAERYGLDVTLARALLKLFGTRPEIVLLGFLLMISFSRRSRISIPWESSLKSIEAPARTSSPRLSVITSMKYSRRFMRVAFLETSS